MFKEVCYTSCYVQLIFSQLNNEEENKLKTNKGSYKKTTPVNTTNKSNTNVQLWTIFHSTNEKSRNANFHQKINKISKEEINYYSMDPNN
jgi:predicted transposase YbfD/YdcC